MGEATGRASGYGAALRVTVVRTLWGGTVVSNVGDYIATAALLVLAAERSGGTVVGPATLFAVRGLPALLTSTLAGSWLDGVRRDHALVALQIGGAAGVLLPLVWPSLLAVYVTGAWLGIVNAVVVSVRSGAMADAVPDEHRGPLLGLLGSTEQTAQVIGFAGGGTLAVLGGASQALVVDAVSFLLAAALFATLRMPEPAPQETRPAVTAGLRDILTHPVLRLLAPLVWVTALVGAIPETQAQAVAPSGSRWYPLVLAAGPAGQALTMLVVGRIPSLAAPSFQLVHLAWLALAFGIAALGASPLFFVVANLLVGSGVAWTIGPQLTFVRQAPQHRMAQITATMIALMIAVEGGGALAFGALADLTSPQSAYRAAGLVVLVSAVVGWLVKERTPRAAVLEAATRPPERGSD